MTRARKTFVLLFTLAMTGMSVGSVLSKEAYWPFHPLDMFSRPAPTKENFLHAVSMVARDGTQTQLGLPVTEPFPYWRSKVLVVRKIVWFLHTDPSRAREMLDYFWKRYSMRHPDARTREYVAIRVYKADELAAGTTQPVFRLAYEIR